MISVVNGFTHEQIKELAPLETMTEMFTEHGKAAGNFCGAGKICLGANLWCWFCNPCLADSGYAKQTVFD